MFFSFVVQVPLHLVQSSDCCNKMMILVKNYVGFNEYFIEKTTPFVLNDRIS